MEEEKNKQNTWKCPLLFFKALPNQDSFHPKCEHFTGDIYTHTNYLDSYIDISTDWA